MKKPPRPFFWQAYPGPPTLAQHGPILRVTIKPHPDIVPQIRARGLPVIRASTLMLIDCGASRSVINQTMVRELHLIPSDEKPRSVRSVTTDESRHPSHLYPVQIGFPVASQPAGEVDHSVSFSLKVVVLPDGKEPYSGLLGRDFLSRVTMIYDGRKGGFEIIGVHEEDEDGSPTG